MKTFLIVIACALWQASAYPYPYYGANMDTFSYGSNDRGMVMSRYFNPYYNSRSVGTGMAAFMFRPEQNQQQASQYYLPDRRRQTTQDNYAPPQQNEVYYPQIPDQAPEQQTERADLPDFNNVPVGTSASELADPTEKTEIATVKATGQPELTEPVDVEAVPETPRKTVTKKKQVKRPVEEEDAEEDQSPPKLPTGAFFPMFFGWGGRSGSGGAPSGATAIANAFSTGRGGVATSHATAYGPPRPETKP